MSAPFGVSHARVGWESTKLRAVLTRSRRSGRADLQLLSVNLPQGVVVRTVGDGRAAPSEDMSGYQEVRPGNLVMNQLGKPHGALGVSNHHGIISPAYFVADVGTRAEPRFIHHLLRTRLYISEYERRGKCMPPSQFDISWEQFRDIDVNLPPLAEQQAIADYLDTETARIDALIAKKQQLIQLLDERMKSLLFDGVSGRSTSANAKLKESGLEWLGAIPEHFGTPTLGANFTAQLGKMLNGEAAEGPDQYPYVKNTNVKWDSIELTDLPTMSFEASDRARCELRAGDLLVCEGGEVGRAAIWPSCNANVYFQKALHRVRPIRDGNTRFLMYCLWAAASLDVFSVEGNQSTIVHLTGEKLREHRFPWPPAAEQDEIVRRIDEGRDDISALAQRVQRQIDLLTEHRQALITAAVTGELAVSAAT